MIRLDKYLTLNTSFSRSEAKKMLSSGKVTVNGSVIKKGDTKISELDTVVCNGIQCVYKKNLYYMLNKPQGVITATTDNLHKTVIEFFPESERKRLVAAGRLDIDTEGLLIITDDGNLVHHITGPNHDVDKVYYAKTEGIVKSAAIDVFQKGIEFRDFTSKPAGLEILSVNVENNYSEILVTIREGKFHQVKRMVSYIGCKVLYLKRVSIGELKLDEKLQPGEYRELTDDELKKLFD